jgi:CelD/BcsL family acetyltransferase involved in cellulose biosynthesis
MALHEAVAVTTSTVTDLARLETDWLLLFPAAHRPTVFLDLHWLRAAWAWRSDSAALHIVRVERMGKPIGLIPLVIAAVRHRGRRIRRVEFLEVPDTQICDLICATGDVEAVAAGLARHLHRCRREWDELRLAKLDRGSPSVPALTRGLREQGFATYVDETVTVPGVDLRRDWETYYSGRTRRLKKSNNHLANRLRRSARRIEIEHFDAQRLRSGSTGAVRQALESLSARSWKATTGLTLDQPGPRRFLTALLDGEHPHEALSIWLLRVDDAIVAAELHLDSGGVVSALRSDFDPGFAEVSVGSYLHWQLLQRLFDGSHHYYCMGPGMNEYKLRWADALPEQITLKACNRNLGGTISWLEDRVARPLVRRLVGTSAAADRPAPVSEPE